MTIGSSSSRAKIFSDVSAENLAAFDLAGFGTLDGFIKRGVVLSLVRSFGVIMLHLAISGNVRKT